MSKLVFVGDPSVTYDANISSIGTNQISVVFASDVPTDEVVASGFDVVNEHNGLPQGSYRSFTHIYNKNTGNANEIWLSNDTTEYVAPIVAPVNDNASVLTNVSAVTLADVVAAKKKDLANSCRASIEAGVTIQVGDHRERFSYSLDGGDQTNIDDIFNTMMTTGIGQYYHADGGECKIYTPEQVFDLYANQKMNKLKHTTYYNQLSQILASQYANLDDTVANRQQVASLTYGVPEDTLTGEYLENYTKIVADGNMLFAAMHEQLLKMLGKADG